MPEGDTIYRTAAQLRRVAEGAAIDGVRNRSNRIPAEAVQGAVVDQIETRGKHLLLHLSSRAALHSHLGMTGSWHIYRVGQAWQKPERLAELVLTFGEWDVVCFTPSLLELLTEDQLRRHPHLTRLGPDVLDRAFDPHEATRRSRTQGATPLGEAIMNQTVACGVGNVYKSEVLFLEALNPLDGVDRFDDDALTAMWRQARRLMVRNLQRGPRTTRFRSGGSRLWVYGRRGQRCLKCEAAVQMRRQGEAARSTYWCPTCQPHR